MEYDKIIKEIKAGLTGDKIKDVDYLMKQSEKYRDHKLAKEILRECGRMIYEIIPEEDRGGIDKIINEHDASYDARLKSAIAAHREGNYDESLAIIEPLIKEIEDANWYKDDSVSEYHHFNEFFEEALYKEYNKPTKTLRQLDFPLEKIYFEYGSLLIDLGRPQDAEKALNKALKWNPADVRIVLERSEAVKRQGKIEKFFDLSRKAFKYAFRPNELAHCYRNVGYYFSDKEMWEEAASCYIVSLQFEAHSEIALSELQYIQVRGGNEVAESVNPETMKKICEKHGLPFGPDGDVLSLAYSYAEHFAKEGEKEGALYCYQILYDLIKSEEIKKKMEAISD